MKRRKKKFHLLIPFISHLELQTHTHNDSKGRPWNWNKSWISLNLFEIFKCEHIVHTYYFVQVHFPLIYLSIAAKLSYKLLPLTNHRSIFCLFSNCLMITCTLLKLLLLSINQEVWKIIMIYHHFINKFIDFKKINDHFCKNCENLSEN